MKDNNTTPAMKEVEEAAERYGKEYYNAEKPANTYTFHEGFKKGAQYREENPVPVAKEGKTAEEILAEYNPNDSAYVHVDDAIGAINDYAAQLTEVKGEEVTVLKQHNEVLKQAINQDKTGLAKGLADVRQLLKGYTWITDGRGPYAYDDERYKGEVLNMINEIDEVALRALRESGTLATSAFHNLQAAPSTHSSSETPTPKQDKEWVRVEDKLPDNGRDVLVSDLESGIVCTAWYSDFEECFNRTVVGMTVTHWMELPAPPQD